MTTPLNLKALSQKTDLLAGGHRACTRCTGTTILRQVLLACEQPPVVGFATGCLEVVTTIYPYTAWRTPYIHVAFENCSAVISGVEAAYRSLKKQGKIDRDLRFIAFGGDGGTYDIGLQALSGAMERGHRMLYVCYDNEAYMNTGIQRSSATPFGAYTTTAPAGKASFGKLQHRKDLTEIMIAHRIPYVAQASPHNWRDLAAKVRKALDTDGPSFLNVLMPCNRGWQFPIEEGIQIAWEAAENCFWPLFEVANGVWKLTYQPKEKQPVRPWLEKQGRFRHLFKPGNEAHLERIQADIDSEWERLKQRCAAA